ncbi:MAG: PIN domain-containing protein [Pseudomonadota bacterium]
MRIAIDLNVLLDVLLDREPHVEHSSRVLALLEQGLAEGYFCAASVDTLDYILTKAYALPERRKHLSTVRRLLAIATVDATVIDAALNLGWDDLEDAIVHESARLAGATAIVTRNPDDFAGASIAIHTPTEFCAIANQLMT